MRVRLWARISFSLLEEFYSLALDEPADKEDVDAICQIFRDQGGNCWFVELAASQATRLERNRTLLGLFKR